MLATIIHYKSYQLSSGLNSYEIDLSDLNSGVYLYSIVIDDILVKSDKINIIK